jgi:thiol:disulfide interchange protein DsbC
MSRILSVLLSSLICASALADEAAVKQALRAKFPKAAIENVQKSDIAGLYEVFMERQVLYTDESVSYIFAGKIIETKTDKNVTEERLRQLTAIKFDTLPLDLAVKTVKGNGQRALAVFSDPLCPYCQQLERELALVTDVTIYTFLYPIESLHPGASEVAKTIWCAPDRSKAWDDWMLRGQKPAGGNSCETPVAELQTVGGKHHVDGTPTMVFADGTVVSGALPVRQLETGLRIAQQKP